MKTIRDVFTAYRRTLFPMYDLNEIEAITLLTINEVCKISKSHVKAFPEFELTVRLSGELKQILDVLETGKPVQYVLGRTEFYGLTFLVNTAVLIPRQETEELVKWVIDSVKDGQVATASILDVGTGSGCIAIALKKNLPDFKVTGFDISAEAIKTAVENAKLNEVAVEFSETDILSATSTAAEYSVIVSNPPYVTETDKAEMHINVTGFEPQLALFVPENDPLIFYKAIVIFAKKNMIKNGLLFLEINESYGADIVELLILNSFNNIELRKDLNRRDRMIKASIYA